MKQLPKEITIGSINYTIVEEPRLKEEGDFARVRLTEAVIEVATPMHPEVALIEIVHEAIHVILRKAGILPPHDEHYVGALAHGFVQFVRDNPGLVG